MKNEIGKATTNKLVGRSFLLCQNAPCCQPIWHPS
jgi:hypothetical protein